MHVHFNMEIVVVSAGVLHMSVNGRDYALARGTGVFVPPFALHDFRSGGVNRCHVLEFPAALAPELAARLRQGVPEDLGFPVPEDCLARLERQLPQGWPSAGERHSRNCAMRSATARLPSCSGPDRRRGAWSPTRWNSRRISA